MKKPRFRLRSDRRLYLWTSVGAKHSRWLFVGDIYCNAIYFTQQYFNITRRPKPHQAGPPT